MTLQIRDSKDFAAAVVDALSSHICVVDQDGVIVTVNRAWQNFAIENPPLPDHAGVGTNYLDICHRATGESAEGAETFAKGVESVLAGDLDTFQMEYPCHSPTQKRWFLGRVTPLDLAPGGAVISHTTITDLKLLEFELLRMAQTDALTGLPNRRYFLETANIEVERVRRFGNAASVVMLDLDHFKAVNDTYGHAAGDAALRRLTQVCKAQLRSIDVFARIGGEEFVILLPGTAEGDAVVVAEKLRCAVRATPIEAGEAHFTMTASFGVAAVQTDDHTVDQCLGRADTALFAAKRTGRDCVMRFSTMARDLSPSDA